MGGRKTFTEVILRSLKKIKTHMNIFSKQNLQSLNKKSYSVHKSQSLQLSMFKIKLTYFTDCFKNVPVRRRYAVVQLCCLGKVQSLDGLVQTSKRHGLATVIVDVRNLRY